MTITLDELKQHTDRLRREIMERECLLATFAVVEKYAAGGRAPAAIDLGSLVSALIPSAHPHESNVLPVPAPATKPIALPSPPPVQRYRNPELEAIGGGHGSDSRCVRWAIGQMTQDYSLHHIAALLAREGVILPTARISVVLSRLKKWDEIEEIQRGQGPIPALFRRPDIARPEDFKPLDLDLELPPPPYQRFRDFPFYAGVPQESRMDDAAASASDPSLRASED